MIIYKRGARDKYLIYILIEDESFLLNIVEIISGDLISLIYLTKIKI
jgi:hypothetical protein